MKINKVNVIYFSPTGNTKILCEALANKISNNVFVYDRTSFEDRWTSIEFCDDELVIIGVPSYYGRMPNIKDEFLRGINGNTTPAVIVTTYGNRDFEDTLLEMKNECEERMFKCIAAGAFISKHTFSDKLGANRPNDKDLEEVTTFANTIIGILNKVESVCGLNLKVPGNYPYRPFKELPMGPSSNKQCNQCMLCVKACPMKAISPENPEEIDGWRCILCGRCIKECPQQAKVLPMQLKAGIEVLEIACAQDKKNITFIAE